MPFQIIRFAINHLFLIQFINTLVLASKIRYISSLEVQYVAKT